MKLQSWRGVPLFSGTISWFSKEWIANLPKGRAEVHGAPIAQTKIRADWRIDVIEIIASGERMARPEVTAANSDWLQLQIEIGIDSKNFVRNKFNSEPRFTSTGEIAGRVPGEVRSGSERACGIPARVCWEKLFAVHGIARSSLWYPRESKPAQR
jgi:hypothetical protein